MFDEAHIAGESDAKNLRLKQAHAMLALFEIDSGRAASTLKEMKEWAYSQEHKQLRSRVDQFLSNELQPACRERCSSELEPGRH